jgi:hypothetical protein
VNKLRRCGEYVRIPAHSDDEWIKPFVAQGVGLAFPLRIGSRLVGIYGCGWSMSRRGYSPQTISLLVTLAPAVASALENTRAYTEIARLNNQLRRLDKLKDEFIEHVGHELRTPVTSLSLALQLLTRQPELMRELIHVVRNSSNSCPCSKKLPKHSRQQCAQKGFTCTSRRLKDLRYGVTSPRFVTHCTKSSITPSDTVTLER